MDCFIDSIGLSYCAGETPPVSGLYLNSLPGISIESLDKSADSEQVTYRGVFNDIQTLANAQFRLNILGHMHKCFALDTGCDYDALICENTELLYQAWWYLLGVHTMTFRLASDRLNWFTTVSREEAKELRGMFHVEYEEALKASVLLMDTTSCCIVCSPSPKRVTWLP